jgi:hypothetical protein
MSLVRTFLVTSGRVSADNRKSETDPTRGIGEALGRAEDDPTAISLGDYRGEDGAGVNSSNQTLIIPEGSSISFADLYGLTGKITQITPTNTSLSTSFQTYRTTSYYYSKPTRYLTRKCFLFFCNDGWTSRTTSGRAYRSTSRTTSKTTSRNTSVPSLKPHRPKPFYRYYRWTFTSSGFRLTGIV